MSHVATVQIEIKDLELLALACVRIGLELVRGQETFRTYDGAAVCEHAIRIPESRLATLQAPEAFETYCRKHPKTKTAKNRGFPHEVGIVARAGGKGWDLKYDSFGGVWNWGGYGLDAIAGQDLRGLKQAYAVIAARAAAVKQGFRIQELHKPNGAIELRLMK